MIPVYAWSTNEVGMSFTYKGLTFLTFCFYLVVELFTFLILVICKDNFVNTNTTSTSRFIYVSDRTMSISDARHPLDFLHDRNLDTVTLFKAMLYSWNNKLLSETKSKFKCWHSIRFWRFEKVELLNSFQCCEAKMLGHSPAIEEIWSV